MRPDADQERDQKELYSFAVLTAPCQEHRIPVQATQGCPWLGHETESGELWASAFTVPFEGRKREGRASKLRDG